MNSVWQRFTLSSLPLSAYLDTSYLHRYVVGLLQSWRQTSFLLLWAEPIAAFLLSVVYVLTPFVPNALVGFLLAACAGFWLLLTVSDETSSSDAGRVTPIHLLVLLYWGIATVATALSPVKLAALSGWQKLTLYLLLFALLARVLKSHRLRSWMILLYLHVALIVSIYGMRQWFFGAKQLATWVDPESGLSGVTRVYSYLGNPNLLAGYLLPAVIFSLMAIFVWQGKIQKSLARILFVIYVACLVTALVFLILNKGSWSNALLLVIFGAPVAVFVWQGRIKQALAMSMFITNTTCMLLTSSRGSWIGLVIAMLALLVLLRYWFSDQIPPFWRRWGIPIILGTLAVLLLVGVIFVEPIRVRVLSIFAGRNDSSNNFRMNVWLGAIELIRDHPENRPLPNYVFGIGPGNSAFNKVYPLYQINPRFTALSAYSVVLEVLVETGIFGLFSFLWLLLVTLNLGWKQLVRLKNLGNSEGLWLLGAIATMLGMLGHGAVDTVWYRPEVNTLWWMIVALIASYYQAIPLRRTKSLAASD
jgi:putative inorganic carbon (HCO3(-)) transporter